MARAILHRLLACSIVAGMFIFLTLAGLSAAPVAQAHGEDATSHVTIWAHNNAAGTQFSFTMSSTTIHAGLVHVTLVNAGTQNHMAQFFKLKPGVTEAQLIKALAAVGTVNGPGPIREVLEIASAAGGADSITPGSRQDVVEPLTAGHYVIVCFDSTPQGVPHFLLGMHLSFFVTGEFEGSGTPAAAGTIVELDHQIIVPAVIHESSALTLGIVVRDQSHEFQLVKVPAGTTRAQLLACLRGQTCTLTAPPIDAGGAGASAPGRTHWVLLHLQPGTYAALCFVPDINTGMPHALMGMVTVFTVE